MLKTVRMVIAVELIGCGFCGIWRLEQASVQDASKETGCPRELIKCNIKSIGARREIRSTSQATTQ
jgi:hypothetical protein